MAKRDEQRKQLWDKWQHLAGTADNALRLYVDEIFLNLRERACDQLSEDTLLFSRLGTSDENIYTHLMDLMDVYHKTVGLAQEYQGSPTILALLQGLCEVLNSRLREFDEEKNGNPVTQEKHSIMDGAILYTARKIEHYATSYSAELQSSVLWNALRTSVVAGMPIEIDIGDTLEGIYGFYKDGLRYCLAGIDNLAARKVAYYYTELIIREWEELNNIIRVQVLALEATDGTSAGADPRVQAVLNMLREAYQQLTPVVYNLYKTLNMQEPAPRTPPARVFETFSKELMAVIPKFNGSQETIKEKSEFFDALREEAASLVGQFRVDYMKAAYRLQRLISTEILLAEEITEVFVKIELPEVPDIAEDTVDLLNLTAEEMEAQKSILSGIKETVEIKIESLKESIAEFSKDGMTAVQNFAGEKPKIPESDRLEACVEVCNAWNSSPPINFEEVDVFFDMCIGSEIFEVCRARVNKQVDSHIERVNKLVLRFKKEIVLYEVCTFEEILTHSVSRLRDSEWKFMNEVAILLDKTFDKLEVILKKNNISVIRPEPHDTFNAREHDILVAEQHEDFVKGEIIKRINSGYRQKDQIILRANVVAAR